jgi:hypothetical protein
MAWPKPQPLILKLCWLPEAPIFYDYKKNTPEYWTDHKTWIRVTLSKRTFVIRNLHLRQKLPITTRKGREAGWKTETLFKHRVSGAFFCVFRIRRIALLDYASLVH